MKRRAAPRSPTTQRTLSVTEVPVTELRPWRELYRQELPGQIVHDALHAREGWTRSYLLRLDGVIAGYGAVAVGGPWRGKPTLFEYYVARRFRGRVFDLFEALVSTSGSVAMEVQSNDVLITAMLHLYATGIFTESILFRDELTTHLPPPAPAVRLRPAPDSGGPQAMAAHRPSEWVLESDGTAVAKGGVLWHYNPPHGDIYMEVAEARRRRGFGSYLVQELKRLCREHGGVPTARCNPANLASRRTLQKAGFAPYGHMLVGSLVSASPAATSDPSRTGG